MDNVLAPGRGASRPRVTVFDSGARVHALWPARRRAPMEYADGGRDGA